MKKIKLKKNEEKKIEIINKFFGCGQRFWEL